MSGNESIDAAHYDQVTTWPRGGLQADIVHIGFGAFHRGHQAVYTDLTNQLSDTHWGIFEINLFGDAQLIENLNAQNGLFSVVETSASQSTSRLVRSVTGGIHTPVDGIAAAIQKLTEPQVKIVSLTITEKGYCLDSQTRSLDLTNGLIKHDLQNPDAPQSAIGLIVCALQQRKAAGLAAFSVLSCDNLPDNGHLTRNAVLGFARQLDQPLAQWIEENVSFPGTMVDRIVPAMTESQFALLETKTGYADPCGIVCESFRQWVIEDNFVHGRPQWDKAGAMFVSNVQPYEEMKLRMLNGGHSFLAYNGSLAGYEFIWQCMEDANFRSITRQLMINEQARTLNPDLNINIQEYADLLIERFSNRNVAHRTGQIAMDGSQKLPQRALTPWLKLHQQKQNNAVLSLLVAGWLHYVIDAVEKSQSVADPMNDQLQALIKEQQDAWQQALALLHLSAIFGDLSNHQPFINEIKIAFANIKNKGIKATISQLLSDEQK
ncbi:TPA: mannitol dehydrogenase family protein [Escherichia coli]|uniref:Putative Fructuronate reductase n=1 Tax=Escherichia coli O83:H1 (strain NRG 857C / AIEC) TaxID=685038 RepID=A0A0H3ELY5_ECO8N|nr:mannitol dehydrogenase family protein [Escherichia coli]EEZ9624309.1 mannitol dehydrogenase family protein [Escherichia coli O32]ADR28402.1 putative Fructuronate reductase [Escherichia coli O83:H1 str. NRG 857C]EEV9093657.1 mannitol dehydrogenase family protein [Escherichia coli]EEW1929592.1 mannitol dehydrogenase family protein [Escherichia coli]EEZ6838622.1 mannitol dehydrogenase family protein [Escherichia coli]